MSERTGLEIAVIGLAGRFPGARDVEELWDNLVRGVESITRFSDEELAATGVPPAVLANPRYVKAAPVLADVDLLDAEFFGFTPRETEVIDPQHRLFLECAWEALESAGYDPETWRKPVGVYAGVSFSTYALLNVMAGGGRMDSLGGLLGADKDHFAPLVSWKLNLEGPSLAVQTACSTSLVAVHLAAQGLLNGECDMALAGGSSIRFPQQAGYLWQEGGIHSPDGHCRAFDADARGTVFGNGLGVVALKRLEDALADGDTIHAVIKGSAINNDGAGRIGYTAPRLEGQAKVIRAAQVMAEVEPETIGFVEAHGTGTPLGDPIEVAALTEVFRAGTDRKGYCALGSVKTNLGHLNAAAGITGLIKAVLALERRTIPPTLHFQRPNPEIDFASSPFFVNAEALPWDGDGEPRRAAVSSFGMGGTNAHVILEEAPEPEPTTPSRPVQMLAFSARSAAALEAATNRLAGYLERSPETDLADVAYTLHVGRRGFSHRRIVLAGSRQEALAVLTGGDPERVLSAATGGRERPVFFLFPGQGAQHVDMARGLYETEAVFREEVDRCADLLKPRLGIDLRAALADGERLGRTAVTQPALFVVEYALAKLWMAWGVRPQGMIGHSIGEYVAACLAGVFSLEDALALVALRGRLIEELPGGAMLAVPLPAERLEPLLGERISLAAVNGPSMCVVSGDREEVERLRREAAPLLAEGLECRPLHTSHAFHSAAMDPVLGAFTEAVRRVSLKAPSLSFVSNVTGRWITAAEATNPSYWARHLRGTVRFSDGLATLGASSPDGVFLEVGPGRTLGILARQHPAAAGRPVLASARHPQDQLPDQETLLRALGQLWLAGVRLDWPAFYARERRRRLPLPTYPFERRRYWIEPRPMALPTARTEAPETGEEQPEPAVTAYHPRPNLGTAYVAPESADERAIAEVWRNLFGLAEVGVHDDFFDLGGHSLLVTRMASQVRAALGLELPLRIFFEERTVARLVAALERERVAGRNLEAPLLAPVPREGELLLSFGQQRLWFLDRLEPGSTAYNMPTVLRLLGRLDTAALQAALDEIVRRHEVLRTTFAEGTREPVQVIHPAGPVDLPVEDLAVLPAEEREAAARRLVAGFTRRPFDLECGPMLRASLLRLGEQEHVALFAMHHIVSDGWSTGVLVREVAALYQAFLAGEPSPLPELPIQYADYAAWQRSWLQGEVLEAQIAYWRARLAGASALELPTDRLRPPVQRFRGAALFFHLSSETGEALATLGQSQGATMFMTLAAAFQVLLHRYSGRDDILVGTPIAGRNRAEVEELIGFFVNTLVLRASLFGSPSFSTHLEQVRRDALEAFAHQDLPFEKVVEELQPERDLSRSPLFQVMFSLQNASSAKLSLPGLTLAPWPQGETVVAKFDLTLTMTERGEGLAGSLEYSTDLFDRSTIDRMVGHFRTLLNAIVADPRRSVSELSLLTGPEREQLLTVWNATDREVPASCVHEGIAAQAVRTPDAVAVTFGIDALTYRELDWRANALAHRLRILGVAPEVRVGVALERSLEMVVGLLAVLKAGGAYVPLDPSYPAERLELMRDDAGISLVLTRESFADAGESELPPAGGARPANLAYVIYTSGSTGRPKGVQISHGALTNFLAAMAECPGIGAGDTLLAVTSLSFDIAGLELYLPLLTGGRVALASREEANDGYRLRELIAESGATMLQATPATWRLLLEAGWEGGEGLKALCGGEPLPPALASSLRERVGALWNVYGPTETTIWSTVEEIAEDGVVTIGRPIANTTIYILDAWGNPVPVGVPGELWIGGAGLARGYLGRPELTAERFVPDPFGAADSRLYRTGDLARYLPDGCLEHLGRIDHQVKVRGYRIELGEIETALGRHPEVTAAVVVAREDVPGDPRLVGYVVSRRADLAGELPSWLGRTLPDYMIPTAWVALEAFPLTPNGKIDRKALPKPLVTAGEAPAEPRTPVEELLAGMWCELLDLESLGIHDNFFALGGHSLKAARLVARVRQAFGVDLPLRRVFESPTVEGLARRIEELRRAGAPQAAPIVPVSRAAGLPLAFSQQRVWILERLEVAGTAYHLGVAVRLQGRLNASALEAALAEVVRRHESLRTVFFDSGGEPYQTVLPELALPLPWVDLRALPEREREPQARLALARLGQIRFDLSRGPLLRAALIVLGAEEHLFSLTLHHIVSDAWSMGILVREVATLYPAFAAGLPSPLEPLPVQYPDFAAWQRNWLQGEALAGHLGYWREQLEGLSPVLELATDKPRRVGRTAALGKRRIVVPERLSEALRDLGRREQATPFMTLLAAFVVLLRRHTSQADIAVGTPIANRGRVELERLIGFFANTLVLRNDLTGDPPFVGLLERTRTAALDAYAHQDLPFERLVEELQPERNLAVNPLFQVMFQMQNVPTSRLELPGDLSLLPVENERGAAMFDLVLAVREQGRVFSALFEYDSELFEAATIERLGGHWLSLMTGAVENPGCPVTELPLLSAEERHQATVEWSDAEAPFPREVRVPDLVEEQVRSTPEAVALSFEGRQLSYQDLDDRASRLAGALIREGVKAGALVGVCLERSPEMVAALLAVWKAGAAYVPMDPSYPEDRLAYMLEDAGISLLLADATTPEGLAARAGSMVRVDRETGELAARVEGNPLDLAYVIYTSGSTGQPKGVGVSQGALVNFLISMRERPGLRADDVLLAVTSLSFDIAGLELFLPLLVGSRIELASRETAGDGERLLALLRESGATVMQATPMTWQMLVEAGWSRGGLKVLCGGEALPERLAAELCRRSDSVWNLYGPTETTVWSAAREVRANEKIVVGPPIANTSLYVLDAGLRPAPLGVPGELWIGGAGLARGYLNRPELTAERFVPDPFGEAGARLYRTGDLARFRSDGATELLGRADFQVKVRGFRIELGEIETALEKHQEVARAVVVSRGDRLAAYLVPRGETCLAASDLRGFVSKALPDYMVPAEFAWVAELPLTPNGKVDRLSLGRIEAPREAGEAQAEPRTPGEELLAGIWSELLGIGLVGVHDNFFSLGGHSLKAMQLVARVRQAFGIELPLRSVFEAPTVAGLARTVDRLRSAGGFVAPPIVPVPRDRELPLSFSQQRVWVLDQLEVAGTAYHLSTAVRLKGRLDAVALEAALNEVVRRHESLRTVFASSHGLPYQAVLPRLDLSLPRVDLSGLPEETRTIEARRVAARIIHLRFDLSRGPLLRPTLVVLGPDEHLFTLFLHHIVSDAWSMGILIREVAILYQVFVEGSPSPLEPLSVQYPDFAAWQRGWLQGEVLAGQLVYWREQLSGLPPVLQLASDKPRRIGRPAPMGQRRVVLPAQLSEVLRDFGRREQATPFMVFLAGFATLLHRYTGQPDIAVGTPIANRSRVELEGLIGFFANTLVLRSDLAGDPPFAGLLERVRRASLDAYAHQDLPFERLVEELQPERNLAVNPLFQVMFQMQNVPATQLALPGGLSLLPVENERGAAMFDLILSVREHGGVFSALFEYDADLFESVTVERLSAHWLSLLGATVAGPDSPVSELPLLSAAELHQVALEWSDTERGFPRVRVPDLFEEQVKRTPDAIAVSFQARRLTYRALDNLADRLARALAGVGIGPEARVGVCLERSPEMVAALLAVWKAGAAYVPMDPSYPEDRLAYMLEDAGVALLLADAATPERLSTSAPAVMRIGLEGGIGEEVEGSPRVAADPENLAYVIYTSGSTGRPKGVEISHGALVSFLDSMGERPGLGADDTLLAVTSLSFDIAGLELFLPLLKGARIELADRETAGDGARLLALLRESGTTAMQATPVTWQMLVEAGWRGGESLKVLCGGEALPEKLAAELCRRSDSVWNLYGPTETTVWSAAGRVREGGRVVVGPPIANTGLYLLDLRLRPAPVGVPGELWIGGLGLARGYHNRPDLTAERFLPDPFAARAGARMYRTGDLARFRPDGAIEFLGRVDHQVKVRGFRIELGEIETALEALPAIERAVVAVRGDESARRLVAWLVPRDREASLSVADLRESLGRILPDYMVPSGWMVLDTLPLTPNGKVDRKALPAPEGSRPQPDAVYVAPRTALEELLAGIWAEVLRLERVGVLDNFFVLGGHSLLATQVVSRVGEGLEMEVPLRRLFEAPTVSGMAEALARGVAAPEDLERSARLVLDLLQLSDEEVNGLLGREQAGTLEEVP